MIAFQALGVRFTLPLLTLIAPILAARLGSRTAMAPLMFSLFAHELSHLAAARILGIAISEIRLMPFGGSARIENPYRLPPQKLVPLALAGPLANLALVFAVAAMAHWGMLSPIRAAAFVRINIILCLFNLMPAFPLDGGRLLYALLEYPLGEKRALNTGLFMGRMLAALLLTYALFCGFRHGLWNLSFILAAVFILASERDERSAMCTSCTQRIGSLLQKASGIQHVRLYQADADSSISSLLPLLHRREQSWFILMHSGMPVGLTSSQAILRSMINGKAPDAVLKDMQIFRILPAGASGASHGDIFN